MIGYKKCFDGDQAKEVHIHYRLNINWSYLEENDTFMAICSNGSLACDDTQTNHKPASPQSVQGQ